MTWIFKVIISVYFCTLNSPSELTNVTSSKCNNKLLRFGALTPKA